MTKNTCAKTVTRDKAYEVWSTPDGSWTWYVLKKWQIDDDKLELIDTRNITILLNNTISVSNLISNQRTFSVLPCSKFKVGDSIVISDTIFVMNSFMVKEGSTNMILNKKAVFGYVFPVAINTINQNQYISLLSFNSTTFVIPSVNWDFQSAGLTKPTSFILNPTTLAEVSSFFNITTVTGMVTPPTKVYATDFTKYGNSTLDTQHEISINHFKWVVKDKLYARWFCDVITPICPDGEMGDVYVSEIKEHAMRIK